MYIRANSFVILTEPRSGSSYLVSLIDQLKNIRCYRELISLYPKKRIEYWNEVANDIPTITKQDIDNITSLLSNKHTVDYKELITHSLLDEVYNYIPTVTKDKDSYTRGFKYFSIHSREVVSYILKNPELKVIYLERSNKLEQLVSFKLAMLTNHWSSFKGDNYNNLTIDITTKDIEQIKYFIKSTYNALNLIRSNKQDSILKVTYEDLELAPITELNRIANYLNTDTVVKEDINLSIYKKQRVRSIEDIVSNLNTLDSTVVSNLQDIRISV